MPRPSHTLTPAAAVRLGASLRATERDGREDYNRPPAVAGMAGRFPGQHLWVVEVTEAGTSDYVLGAMQFVTLSPAGIGYADLSGGETDCVVLRVGGQTFAVGDKVLGLMVDERTAGTPPVTSPVFAAVAFVGGGGGTASDWFPARVTGSGGSPLAYSWAERRMTAAGTWADAGATGTLNAYRMPSDEAAPVVETDQLVLMRASPATATKYEFTPWGSITAGAPQVVTDVTVTCNGDGTLTVTQTKKTVKGRDVTVA